jgi:DtxR family Mn-dependent transcriptional regulator
MLRAVTDVRGHSTDEYLETIYFLSLPIGEYRPARATAPIGSRVAERLGVSRAAVGDMLRRLELDGLVTRDEGRVVELTATGRERAERVVRRHRIIERFLTDFLGYGPAECHEHAERLGEAFTDDMVDRIDARLGRPERCPHGWPVDTAAEQRENAELTALADVATGTRVAIVRLAEHDEELLRWLYREGFVPGADVEVVEAQRAAGQLRVVVDGDPRAVADKAAASVYVRRPAVT